MICESGSVVSVEGDWVWVETRQTSACNACNARSGCGQGLLNSVFSGKRHLVKVAADSFKGKVSVDDQVEIAIPEHVMLQGSFWVYLLPLVLMIAGAVVAQNWSQETSDLPSIVGAGLGFLTAGIILRWHSVRHQANPKYQPVLHSILQSASKPAEVVTIQP